MRIRLLSVLFIVFMAINIKAYAGDETSLILEAAKFIMLIRDQGQTVIVILIIILLSAIATSVWIIWQQRQAIALVKDSRGFVDEKLKSVEANMKAADTLREEGRKTQEASHAETIRVFESAMKVNDELRKEMDRINKKQEDFQIKIKQSIDVGIRDIQDRMKN